MTWDIADVEMKVFCGWLDVRSWKLEILKFPSLNDKESKANTNGDLKKKKKSKNTCEEEEAEWF